MKAKLVRIGNSRGVRIPKLLIEEAGLGDDVDLQVREGAIVIAPASGVRAGWAAAARVLHERGGDTLESFGATRFDGEWTW